MALFTYLPAGKTETHPYTPSRFAVMTMTVLLLLTLAIAGNNGLVFAETVTISHELGTTTVPIEPERVVVFDFGVLDSLEKLGIDVVGLPKSNLPAYLSQFAGSRYTSVGTLIEPDFEAINALKPDLIIISARQSAHYEELSRLAPTVYMGTDNNRYIASVKENLQALGRIFNKEEAVEEELAALDQTIERIRSLGTGQRALILLVTGGRANAYGPGSRYGFVHAELGIAPVDDKIDDSTHGQVISWEYVLTHDPDLIFVIDRDAVVSGGGTQTARQVVENELVRFTKAYRTGNITYLDPSYWYLSGGGLTSLAMMFDDVEQALLRASP